MKLLGLYKFCFVQHHFSLLCERNSSGQTHAGNLTPRRKATKAAELPRPQSYQGAENHVAALHLCVSALRSHSFRSSNREVQSTQGHGSDRRFAELECREGRLFERRGAKCAEKRRGGREGTREEISETHTLSAHSDDDENHRPRRRRRTNVEMPAPSPRSQ